MTNSTAKEKKQFLYAQEKNGAGAKGKPGAGPLAKAGDRTLEGHVIRVWSGDQVSIVDKTGKERRVQLSSTRAPKATDPKQAFYAAEAKEVREVGLTGCYR